MKHDLRLYRSKLISLLETHFNPDLIGLVHYLDEQISAQVSAQVHQVEGFCYACDCADCVAAKLRLP